MQRALQEHGGSSDYREALTSATKIICEKQTPANRAAAEITTNISQRANLAVRPSVLTGVKVPRGIRETIQPGGTSDYKAALIEASISARAWKPLQE